MEICHTYAMRTTIELPDQLLMQAKSRAALDGKSLREFFIEAVEKNLNGERKRVWRPPPQVGSMDGPKIGLLTREQIDEAMFG
jgi:hypothetical protein